MKAVLTFHSIDDSGSVLSYPVDMFRNLVFTLVKNATPVVSIDELYTGSDGVVLSFDDGMSSVSENALPILREAGVPAHLFLTTGAVGRDNRWPTQPADAQEFSMMNWDDINTCIQGGMIVESHTLTHPYLTKCSDQQIVDECATANSIIEKYTGRKPTAFAYPYGAHDSRVFDVIRPIYEYAVTTTLDYLSQQYRPHLIPRIDTYYLRKEWLISDIFSPPIRTYIKLRRTLRQLRGSA